MRILISLLLAAAAARAAQLESPALPKVGAIAPLPQAPAPASVPALAAAAAMAEASPEAAVPAAAVPQGPAAQLIQTAKAAGQAQPGAQASGLLRAFDGGLTGSEPPALPEGPPSEMRLSGDVTPVHYDVALDIDPDAERFSGRTSIEVEVRRPASRIVLHAQELDVKSASVLVAGREIAARRISFDRESGMMALDLPETIPAGRTSLRFSYGAPLNRHMEGLYLSKAVVNGHEEKYAFSQAEPAHARRMTPSFDEPGFKAAFRLTVTAPKELVAISNMPAESRSVSGSKQTVTFQTTPPMSTYIWAVAVANLAAVKTRQDKVAVKVWTLPHQLNQARFALEVDKWSLGYLNKYFGTRYPLPKVDDVAVPDFAAGAMENWGAVFSADETLLVHPRYSSLDTRKEVALTRSHELVHQWNGNLVTPKWWDDLWLNESFATWLSYKMIDRYRPGWRIWEDFEADRQYALNVDALKNTHPVSAVGQVKTPADAEQMFDALSYEKAGSILFMLENYLGERVFRKGVRDFINKHAYGSAEAADLWNALQGASGKPISRVAKDWITQPGHPIVTVARGGPRALRLTQRRFGAVKDEQLWPIPMVIRYRMKGERRIRARRVLFKDGRATVYLPGRGEVAWVEANGDAAGFYRVDYEDSLFQDKLRSLRSMTAIERSRFLDDLWHVARYDGKGLDRFLAALEVSARDRSPLVIREVCTFLSRIHDLLPQDDAERRAYDSWASALLKPHFRRLGWDPERDESTDTQVVRNAVLDTLTDLSPSPEFVAQAVKRARRYLEDPDAVDPSLTDVVLKAAAKSGDRELFAAYRAALAKVETPEQRDDLLHGLAAFPSAEAARALLEMTLTEEIRPQNASTPYADILGDPKKQDTGWDFLRSHWRQLRDLLGDSLAAGIAVDTDNLQGRHRAAEVEAFFKAPENAVPEGSRGLEQALERIESNAKFVEDHHAAFARWLAARGR